MAEATTTGEGATVLLLTGMNTIPKTGSLAEEELVQGLTDPLLTGRSLLVTNLLKRINFGA